MLVAALTALGAAAKHSQRISDRARGVLLAQDLMSEILAQAYEDPTLGTGSFGLGADETGDGSRELWDDVDDYNGWSAGPPEDKHGAVLPDLDGWERSATVAWVSPSDLTSTLNENQGLKRITVSITHNGVEVASLSAIRSWAWQVLDAQDAAGD
jgi:hypothetical protein